jgi:putative transposase
VEVERARDLLQRDFAATALNEKWVADLTYIRTWNGFVYPDTVRTLPAAAAAA